MDALMNLRDEVCDKLPDHSLKIRVGFGVALVKQRDLIDKVNQFVDFYEQKLATLEDPKRIEALFEPVCKKVLQVINTALESGELPQDVAKFMIFHKPEIQEVLQSLPVSSRPTGREVLLNVLRVILDALVLVDE